MFFQMAATGIKCENLAPLLTNLPFQPDMVFTHGEKGDYGHQGHVEVNKATNAIYKNVWELDCRKFPSCSSYQASKKYTCNLSIQNKSPD